VNAYRQLVDLQEGFVANVENDAATVDDLRVFSDRLKEVQTYFEAVSGSAESEHGNLLNDQLSETESTGQNARTTFEDFKNA